MSFRTRHEREIFCNIPKRAQKISPYCRNDIKYILLLPFLFLISIRAFAQNVPLTRAQYVHTQTVKSDTLNMMAMKLAVPGASAKQLDQAIEYIMKGRFAYSRFRDTMGMRLTFDNLAYVYRLQKKLVQAKWFYIESNSASRDMKDTLGIIKSLINLAMVKADIKDYEMGQRDLTDALMLAHTRPGVDEQIAVETGLAQFYTKKGDDKRATGAFKRIIFLKDSVLKAAEAQRLALLKKQTDELSLIKQKQLLLQTEEARLKNLLDQKKGITVVTVLLIAVITLLFFGYYVRRKRRKRKRENA